MNSSGHNRSGPGPIPPRWLNCPRKSATLIGNKFLAFKTPLSHKFDDQVPAQNIFTPSMLFQAMASYKVKIGLWIDLTNTSRFYDKSEIEKQGARYFKIQCRGHGECPSTGQVKLFTDMCATFISKCPLECIAVHCTHGFNRTGLMIASYFIDKEGWGCDRALHEFSIARPPGIYKGDYITELYQRYEDVQFDRGPPEVPDWGQGGDMDEDDGIQMENGDQTNRREGKARKVKISSFMDGVPGVTQLTEEPLLSSIQKRFRVLCGWNKSGFPGCQPVSMSHTNLHMLSEKPYKVSWKADGTRYMMLIDGKEKIYFADRDHCIFIAPKVEFREKHDLQKPLCDTLLDGEMVIDSDRGSGQKFPRYLVYDAIRIHGKDIMGDTFHLRFERILTDIILPRNAAIKNGMIDKTKESFSVRRKDFYETSASTVCKLLSPEFNQQLGHEPDGLILQPEMDPYVPGRCDSVLKWKPLSMNSVDFKIKIVKERGEGILPTTVGHLYVGGLEHPYAMIKANKMLKELNGKIIECKFEDGKWVFMRERTDKSFPNGYNTAVGVCESIKKPITEQMLFDFINVNGYKRPDRDLMPPPAAKRKAADLTPPTHAKKPRH